MSTIYKPPSITGRMSHNTLPLQVVLPELKYTRTLREIRKARYDSALSGKTYMVAKQQTIRIGDLVEWAPTGKRGLWIVINLNPVCTDYSDLERRIYDKKYRMSPCAETTLDVGKKTKQRVSIMDVTKGKLRLKWFSGWRGYEGLACPVMIKIEDVTVLNEMETLGLAAS